jgi:hypothetical protein
MNATPEIKMMEDRLPPANEFGQHFTDPEEAISNKMWITAALQAALAALTAIECVVTPAQARKIALQTRIGIAVSSGVLTEAEGLAELKGTRAAGASGDYDTLAA